MAKGFKHGAGGGGAALNFKVVGNPQPEAPRENTIWVNTDVPIGAWYFSATQPENLNEGDVWFPTGTSSPVEFNALKKNGIQVYPLYAMQYVGGACVDVEAEIYQGGAWVDWWNGDFYKNGNTFDAHTGGLKLYPYKSSTAGSNPVEMTYTNENGVVSVSGGAGSAALYVENPIDASKWSKVVIDVISRTGTSDFINMMAVDRKANNFVWIAFTELSKTGRLELTLNPDWGEVYIIIALSGGEGSKSITFDYWGLER